MKRKLSAKEEYHIKEIAKLLPIIVSDTHEKHLLLGKDILEWNTITEIDGAPIDPDKKYVWRYPVQLYHNHHRRLKKAYKKNNMEGVWAYLKKVNDIIVQAETGNALSAFMELQKYINGTAA